MVIYFLGKFYLKVANRLNFLARVWGYLIARLTNLMEDFFKPTTIRSRKDSDTNVNLDIDL